MAYKMKLQLPKLSHGIPSFTERAANPKIVTPPFINTGKSQTNTKAG
jgi:hypothetical protein